MGIFFCSLGCREAIPLVLRLTSVSRSMCSCCFDVFLGEDESTILLLCHLDPTTLFLLLIDLAGNGLFKVTMATMYSIKYCLWRSEINDSNVLRYGREKLGIICYIQYLWSSILLSESILVLAIKISCKLQGNMQKNYFKFSWYGKRGKKMKCYQHAQLKSEKSDKEWTRNKKGTRAKNSNKYGRY